MIIIDFYSQVVDIEQISFVFCRFDGGRFGTVFCKFVGGRFGRTNGGIGAIRKTYGGTSLATIW